MFINKTNIKLLAAALLTALAAPSCLNLDETQDAGYGYLTISDLDVDVQVEQLVPTKAGETVDISGITGYSAPSLSSVTVTSKTDASKTYTWTSGVTLKLPAGIYTLSATSGSNGFGASYFVGSGEVTVPALETAQGTVTFNLGNSVMKVTNGMTDHVDSSKPITISSSEVSGNVGTGFDSYVFVPSGKALTLSGTNTAGAGFSYGLSALDACKAYDVTLSTNGVTLPSISLSSSQVAWGDRIFITDAATFTGNISEANKGKIVYEAIPASSSEWSNPSEATSGVITGLTTGTSYKVRARVGALVSNEITLTPAVTGLATTAAHTTTNSELDGTDVTTTFTSPATQVADLISSWTYQLYKSDGTTLLRKYNDADGTVKSDGSAITATDGWPYLPQGTYKLKATATLTDGKTVSSTMDLSVGAPSFTPTVSLGNTSYTSYDKYAETNGITKDINGANNCQPETLYAPSAVIGGISLNLIKNSNYTKTISFAVDGTQKSNSSLTAMTGNTHTGDNITSLSWGSHTLTATFTFDGKSATSSPKTHHITGLPYSVSFYGITSAPAGWTIGGSVKWEGYGWDDGDSANYLRLRGNTTFNNRGYALSPKYSVPNDITAQSILTCFYYHSTVNYKEEIYVNADNGEHSEITTNKTTLTSEACFYANATMSNVKNEIPLSSTNSYVSITHGIDSVDKGPLFNSTYFMGLISFTLNYLNQ